jgi:hypothetical protein
MFISLKDIIPNPNIKYSVRGCMKQDNTPLNNGVYTILHIDNTNKTMTVKDDEIIPTTFRRVKTENCNVFLINKPSNLLPNHTFHQPKIPSNSLLAELPLISPTPAVHNPVIQPYKNEPKPNNYNPNQLTPELPPELKGKNAKNFIELEEKYKIKKTENIFNNKMNENFKLKSGFIRDVNELKQYQQHIDTIQSIENKYKTKENQYQTEIIEEIVKYHNLVIQNIRIKYPTSSQEDVNGKNQDTNQENERFEIEKGNLNQKQIQLNTRIQSKKNTLLLFTKENKLKYDSTHFRLLYELEELKLDGELLADKNAFEKYEMEQIIKKCDDDIKKMSSETYQNETNNTKTQILKNILATEQMKIENYEKLQNLDKQLKIDTLTNKRKRLQIETEIYIIEKKMKKPVSEFKANYDLVNSKLKKQIVEIEIEAKTELIKNLKEAKESYFNKNILEKLQEEKDKIKENKQKLLSLHNKMGFFGNYDYTNAIEKYDEQIKAIDTDMTKLKKNFIESNQIYNYIPILQIKHTVEEWDKPTVFYYFYDTKQINKIKPETDKIIDKKINKVENELIEYKKRLTVLEKEVKNAETKLNLIKNPILPKWYHIFQNFYMPETETYDNLILTTPQKERYAKEVAEEKAKQAEEKTKEKAKQAEEKAKQAEEKAKQAEEIAEEKAKQAEEKAIQAEELTKKAQEARELAYEKAQAIENAKAIEKAKAKELAKELAEKERLAEEEYYEKRKELIANEKKRIAKHNEQVMKEKEEYLHYMANLMKKREAVQKSPSPIKPSSPIQKKTYKMTSPSSSIQKKTRKMPSPIKPPEPVKQLIVSYTKECPPRCEKGFQCKKYLKGDKNGVCVPSK